MNKEKFIEILNNKILVLDGATGTELQKRGMPKGVCPEKWVSENPQAIIDVQRAYKKAGSNIVYSCTFGANRFKLEEFGLEKEVYSLNKKLVEISREAVGNDTFVAGDISPTGKFVEPFGDVKFDEAVEVFKEQAKGLLDGGVDFFVIETMIDIQEMRAAVIAIKEICNLPIVASMTFAEDGFTLTGTDSVSAVITLQSLGVSAVGCNCSTGPDKMIEIIKKIKPYTTVPLIAKPNAGIPRLIDGKTIFDMSPAEFGKYIPQFIEAGVNLLGGCCGTSPEYIKEISSKIDNATPKPPVINKLSAVSSPRKYLLLNIPRPLTVIGERINPTGKKLFQQQLREGSFEGVRKFANEQSSSGADMLDVNMGMSGIDEKEYMLKSISLLTGISDLPLCIDSSDPDVIESALRLYPGRALLNSISYEKNKIEKLLPVAAKYGAMFIALPLTDNEIPKSASGRIEVFEKILNEAKKYGFTVDDIVVDGLVMTVSADQEAAKETLKFIRLCREIYEVNSVVGLSNVSFGLPERKLINSSFLSMAIYSGLTMAIANSNEEILMNAKYSSDVLVANDKESKKYIEKYSVVIKEEVKNKNDKKTITDLIYDSIIEGNKDKIVDFLKEAVDDKIMPQTIVDDYLIKAINKVGDLYEKKIYFLPQLIASAETMKKAFSYIEPFLIQNKGEQEKKKKVIMATVKGDIHDIGKNIVILMLKNYGFEVIDLGKDVPSEFIIKRAIEESADIIGLSALMTTTMTEMKTVVDMAKEKRINSKIIIGGAVITQEYSDEIGADGYSRDSVEAVKLAKKLCNIS